MKKNNEDFLGELPEIFGESDAHPPRKKAIPAAQPTPPDNVQGHERCTTIIWLVNVCPSCGSERLKVITVRKNYGMPIIRWVHCQGCGNNYKAVQEMR